MTVKVNSHTIGIELALRNYDAIASTISKESNGLTILSSSKGSLESFVLGCTNLSNINTRSKRAGTVAIAYPLVTFRSCNLKGIIKVRPKPSFALLPEA